MKENLSLKKKRVAGILRGLRKVYPEVRCALDFSDPWQLLVATVLSAQCTDKRVNLVTPALFRKYPSVKAFAKAGPQELQGLIRSTGFYKNKAKSILGAAKTVLTKFGGKVPARMEDLVTIPGVGRKTANVILGNAFGMPGLAVDTHMIRINRLLGLTRNTDPVKIERDLMAIVPEAHWTEYSHLIIRHGRTRCLARRPDCRQCEIALFCPSAGKGRFREGTR
ncbi:MAG TPA: endonuclease III [Candidatus Omnitrophota bacterium]|nr:endonuclease III [Candidatus Omnitrophota bacterium]HPS37275.1 endonuclease III [Candidatus Omnitrophota bacterium]